MTPRPSRVHRLLLRLYPRRFRERHGEEMLRVLAERARDARVRGGRFGAGVNAVTAFADVVLSAVGAHIDERGEGRHAAGAPVNDAMHRLEGRGGMDTLFKDVRYAVRTLLRRPGFAFVATLTIGLGIGANSAIFSVVRAVLLQPLPYEDPEELVIVWGELRNRGIMHFPSSPPDVRDYQEQADLFEELGAVFTFSTPLIGDGDPVQVDVAGVSANFLSMLGVEPVLGRSFAPDDAEPDPQGLQPGQPGALPQMALLSHALWQQRFGGDTDVLGRTVEVGGGTAEIIGVMPPDFELLMPANAALISRPDIWLAARIDPSTAPRNNVFLIPVGRLRDGVSRAQLQAQLDRIAAELATEDPVWSAAGYAVRAESLHEDLTAGVRPVLLALFGAVVFVLLIACANVSNLLLVRASARGRELAVRAAMGGSRARLIRQLLIESGLLALAGAVVGVVLAVLGVSLLLGLQPEDLPRIGSVRVDGMVLLFTLLSAGGAALVFGVLPALHGSRVDLADALKERGSAGAGAARKAVRNGIVIGEVALSLVLLIGAGLMARSFVELTQIDPGFEPEGLVTFSASLPFARYPEAADRYAFAAEVQRRIESLPGVDGATRAFPLPLTDSPFNGRYGPEEALTDPEAFRQAAYRSVLPGYFETMGTRLLAGRTFTEADNLDSAAVVVVDEKLAASLWPDGSAIGERFLVRVTSSEPEWVEVIGVVEHQRADDLAVEGMETVYYPDRYVGGFGGTWAVRASVDPLSLVGAIRSEIAAVDPDVPLSDVQLMDAYVARSMAQTKFALTLIGVFGLVALVLAAVGLYGVLSYSVRQRTGEIGVRMAFGAERESILKLVVGQGLGLAAAGVGLGLLAAFALTGVIESMLVGVQPTDPLTFAGISAVFVLVAAFSCYVPAKRATRVDPVTALRED